MKSNVLYAPAQASQRLPNSLEAALVELRALRQDFGNLKQEDLALTNERLEALETPRDDLFRWWRGK